MKRTQTPHPWSVWIGKKRVATTLRVIDAATIAVLHGRGTRVRFIDWIVGVVSDDATDIATFAAGAYRAAIAKQCHALRKLKRVPAVVEVEVLMKERRSA